MDFAKKAAQAKKAAPAKKAAATGMASVIQCLCLLSRDLVQERLWGQVLAVLTKLRHHPMSTPKANRIGAHGLLAMTASLTSATASLARASRRAAVALTDTGAGNGRTPLLPRGISVVGISR